VSTDVVSAEKAQQVIDAVNAACELGGMSCDEEAAALTTEALARTVLTLHARLDAVAAERDGLREDHRAASNACASATLRAGFFADIVHGVVRVIEPRDGEATVDAAKRVASELAVLRAQLPPLLAVHDALVAAAALPGAGASGAEMVAAVRAKASADAREDLARIGRLVGCDSLVGVEIHAAVEHELLERDAARDAAERAERERDDARAEVETLRAEVALLREIIAWPTVTP
jgi:hypothetical protein